MRILAIDSATPVCAVALWDDGRVPVEVNAVQHRTHTRLLMTAVDCALKMGGITFEQLDGLAVGCGPGSFTGLRIGISTVQGLAMAADKPVVSVSTLEALALQAEGRAELVCPMIDARRGEVYWALYRRCKAALESIEPAQAGSLEHVLARIPAGCHFIGSGVAAYRQVLQHHPGACIPVSEEAHKVRGLSIAQLGGAAFAQGAGGDPAAVRPIYLRSFSGPAAG